MPDRENLTLKWGTLKAWRFNEKGPAFAALQEYFAAGKVSSGAMTQRDTPEQKRAICAVIDALDADTVYLDWDGIHVSKDRAKDYVLEYGNPRP